MIDILITDRLTLRNYQETDIENIRELRGCPEVWIYSTNKVDASNEGALKYWKEVSQKYLDGKCSFQGLFLKETQEFIGEAGVLSFNEEHSRAVIGYNILPRFWRSGYATEITKGLVNKLFYDLGVERIEGLTCESNIGSRKVLEKSGFQLEGVLRHYAKMDREYLNVCFYGIIRSDIP